MKIKKKFPKLMSALLAVVMMISALPKQKQADTRRLDYFR